MTPKKAKNVPVEEEVKEEVAPVEEEKVEEAPVEEVPAENLDPVNEEIPEEERVEEPAEPVEENVENPEPAEEPAPVEEAPLQEPAEAEEVAPVDPHPAEEELHNVSIEAEKKQFSILGAPEEIQKIITFYGVTSQDLFDGNVENMGLKADELKALKEWYATLE